LEVFNFFGAEVVDWMSDGVWDELADIVFKVKPIPPIRARKGKYDKGYESDEGKAGADSAESGLDESPNPTRCVSLNLNKSN
jgi:hypothetical protein